MVNYPFGGKSEDSYRQHSNHARNKGPIVVLILGAAIALVYNLNPMGIKSDALSFATPIAHADSDKISIEQSATIIYNQESIHNPNNLDPESVAKKVQLLVNQHRQDNAIAQLGYDSDLASIALLHSRDMAENNYLSHYDNDGNGPLERAERAGYYCYKYLGDGYYTKGIGENIAQNLVYDPLLTYYNGVPDYDWLTEDELAESIFTQWKTSPGNNENMLDNNYDREGIGIVIDSDGKVYATENFC